MNRKRARRFLSPMLSRPDTFGMGLHFKSRETAIQKCVRIRESALKRLKVCAQDSGVGASQNAVSATYCAGRHPLSLSDQLAIT